MEPLARIEGHPVVERETTRRRVRILRAPGRALIALLIASMCAGLTPIRAVAVTVSAVPVKADPGIDETNAAAGGGRLSWDQESAARPGHFDEYAQVAGSSLRINRAGTQGLGGGADGDTLVFEQDAAGDHDIVLYDLSTRARTPVLALNTWSGAQGHPTVSGPWILLDREDSRGLTQVILYNRITQEMRTVARRTSASTTVYAGQVNGNYAVWGATAYGAWDVFLYDVAGGTNTRILRPPGVAYQYTPAVTPDGTVYFTRGDSGCGKGVRIMRHELDGSIVQLTALPDLTDTGYMYAYRKSDGATTLFFNRSRCRDRSHYVGHPWDIYKIDSA